MRKMSAAGLLGVVLHLVCSIPAPANTYGSVEPIPSDAVADSSALRAQPLAVRAHFAHMLAGCGVVAEVIDVLSSTGAVTTIDELNSSFAVGAGGFAGETNPSYVFTFIDDGPNAATHDDITTLTNGLGYVLSQGSAFLLDADDPGSFDFPANYVVVNFARPPSMEQSAALFETVGDIDPDLFETFTSGYTQYGRAYLSLQSDVDDAQFIAGYREAAARLGLQYSPVVEGVESLFRGGAAFPGNDWSVSERGEEYLARIPAASRAALGALRDRYLAFSEQILRIVAQHADNGHPTQVLMWRLSRIRCP
jgi:hypothetical protein